jgi:hypothetical protein
MRIVPLLITLIGLLLNGCVGHPIPIPYPESELGPPPGMPTGALGDDSSEVVILEPIREVGIHPE